MDKNKCSSCGETKCSCKNKEFTKAVIEIDNPEQITLMRRVAIPASMGDDTTVPPTIGKYHNVLLYYEANSKSYLYSSDGIPTQLVNGVTDYEQAVNLPQINGVTLLGDKSSADLKLADAPMVITVANGNTSWSGADTAEDVYNFFLNKGKVNIVFNGGENYAYEVTSAGYIPEEEKMMCTLTAATITAGETAEFDGNALVGTMTLYTADKAIDVGQIELQPKLYVTDFTGLDLNYNELSGVPATNAAIGMVKPGDGLEVASDGTLSISDIEQYAHFFDTVADMKAATNLTTGDYARTGGFHTVNDEGGALYKITDTGTANEMNVIAVGTGLYATLIIETDYINVKQFGAYGDNDHDDLSAIQACIDYGHATDNLSIYLPEGRYVVGNAISLYEYMELRGNTRTSVHIIKNVNTVDSDTNVDAVLILKKSADMSLRYTHGTHINNVWFEGNRTTTYGIYCPTESPRIEIDDVSIQKAITGIKLHSGWLYAIKDTSINPVENGIDIGELGTSTTLNMTNVYVNGGTGIGYKLKAVGYSGLTNIACDGNSGTPYQFEWCNLSIDGFGCECPRASGTIYCVQSKVDVNNATIVVNPTSSDYVCIDVGTSELSINKAVIHDYGDGNTETPGKFLNVRDKGNTKFTNCTIDKKFATANTYSQPNDNQKFSNVRGEYIANGNTSVCGVGAVNYREDDFTIKTNQDFHMGSVLFNTRANPRYSLDGQDRRYKPAHDLGDIVVNQAPAVNGIAMFQQISDSRNRDMAGTISSTNISGDTGTITLTTLDLTDFSKLRGLVVEDNHDITSSSGGTATISSVDTGTDTLTLSSVTGTFAVGDTLVYKGKTQIGNSTYSNIQSIGYGTTAQRPSTPVDGYMYWDTTLGKPIWRVGNGWKDATGANV